jgi:hypothetical protein
VLAASIRTHIIVTSNSTTWEVVMENKQAGMFMRALASVCKTCPVCRTARRNQEGLAYSFVKNIEGGFCPFCMAYERVYGRKAHEPMK